MPEEIEKYKQTKKKRNFAADYGKALKLEQFLKTRQASLAAGMADVKEQLQQVQGGMQLMVKVAEAGVINTKESLPGQMEMTK